MKIMADTNILFSALLLPRDVVSRKRPDLLADIDVLLAKLSFELVTAPE